MGNRSDWRIGETKQKYRVVNGKRRLCNVTKLRKGKYQVKVIQKNSIAHPQHKRHASYFTPTQHVYGRDEIDPIRYLSTYKLAGVRYYTVINQGMGEMAQTTEYSRALKVYLKNKKGPFVLWDGDKATFTVTGE